LTDKKAIGKMLAAIIVVIVAIAAIGGSYFYLNMGPSPSPSPESGGTLVLAHTNEPTGLSPTNCMFRYIEGVVAFSVFENLVDVGDDLNIHPHLATNWSISPDLKTYTFTLQRGVTFHDGEPFNAAAVAKNFKYYNDTLGGRRKYDIDHWEIIDDYTVKLVYTKPKAFALNEWGWYCGMLSPKAFDALGEKGFARQPVGTGPFKFVEWIAGSQIVLERFDGYWSEKPYLDKIVLRFMPELSTQLLEFEAGNTHIMDFAESSGHILRLNATGNFNFYVVGPDSQSRLAFNTARTPYNNSLVREAINYAINKGALVNAIYYGYGKPAVGPIRYGFEPYYKPELSPYTYNLTKAEELLDKAGYPRGTNGVRFTTSILCQAYKNWDKIAIILKDQLAKVGITAQVDLQEGGIYQVRAYQSHEFDLLVTSWAGSSETPYGWLTNLHSKDIPKIGKIGWNYASINDSRIDALIDELEMTSLIANAQRVEEVVDEIVGYVLEGHYSVFLVDPLVVHGTQSYVKGYEPTRVHPKPSIICDPALNINVWLEQ
jgi:peptide/nickel transport system substrate-binding protein